MNAETDPWRTCQQCGDRATFSAISGSECYRCQVRNSRDRRTVILIVALAAICAFGAVKCRAGVVTESFISRVIWKESKNNPKAVGKAGERGIGQLTRAAWRDVNAYYGWNCTYEQAVTIYARQYIEGFLLMQEGRLRAHYRRQPSEVEVYRSYNRGFAGSLKGGR